MSDERLQILKMVEQGKVSAEEATRLLDALGHIPKSGSGPKATHLRLLLADGRRTTNLSFGVGLARWVLSVPMLRVEFGEMPVDADRLVQLIDTGFTGKVVEFSEENRRLEIWLDP